MIDTEQRRLNAISVFLWWITATVRAYLISERWNKRLEALALTRDQGFEALYKKNSEVLNKQSRIFTLISLWESSKIVNMSFQSLSRKRQN